MRHWALAFAVAAFAVLAIPSAMRRLCGDDAMPQVVRGEGALAVAFGDAREVLGRALVQKADSYFHGGIDMDCHVSHEAEREHHDELHDEHEHHHGEGCGCEECSGGHEEHLHGQKPFDPWAWINSRVRAPQEHRHLDGKKSVELIPWLWASVAADPHNIEAWTTAAYVAGDMMKDANLARRIVAAGQAKNPKSVRLRFYEGRVRYARGKGDLASARAAFASARDLAVSLGLDALPEEERTAYEFAGRFIEEIDRRTEK